MAIKNSDYYKEKLDNYNSQFTSALDDFKKYYVFLILILNQMNIKILMII